MSIINDAIKKARKEFAVKEKDKEPSLEPSVESSVESSVVIVKEETPFIKSYRSSELKWAVVIIVSLVFMSSWLGSLMLYRHMTQLDKDYTASLADPEPKTVSTTSGAFVETVSSSVETGEIKDIVELTGIVYGPEDKWAIINNKIVREGEALPGGKLTLIAKDFVTIEDNNGEEIILDLR